MHQGYAQQEEDLSPNRYRFRYKSVVYKGTRLQITAQIRSLKNNSLFVNIPEEYQEELLKLFKEMKHQAIPRLYKKNAIVFLDALYEYEEFLIVYHNALIAVIKDLKADMRRLDFKFEREYTRSKLILNRITKEDPDNDFKIGRLQKDVSDSKTKLLCHRWMKKRFDQYSINIIDEPDDLVQEFKKAEAMNAYMMFKEDKVKEIRTYLENQIIEFYYKKSLPEIDPDELELNYTDKI
ncbi:hypothetical protein J8M14_20560 [Aquimarina sp. MMG016]|nr:hypothetical protein [Aquimarina sp. MMG016]